MVHNAGLRQLRRYYLCLGSHFVPGSGTSPLFRTAWASRARPGYFHGLAHTVSSCCRVGADPRHTVGWSHYTAVNHQNPFTVAISAGW